jgi:hypothetical protein
LKAINSQNALGPEAQGVYRCGGCLGLIYLYLSINRMESG